MSDKKPKGKAPGRPPGRQITEAYLLRLDPVMWEQWDKLCDLRGSKRGEEIRRAMVKEMREEKLWPPPEQEK